MKDPNIWDRYEDAVREAALGEPMAALQKQMQAEREARDLYLPPRYRSGSHTARMLEELRELEKKHRKLTDFLRLYSQRLYWQDNLLMRLQAGVMRQYRMILKARIKRG